MQLVTCLTIVKQVTKHKIVSLNNLLQGTASADFKNLYIVNHV